jgi:hypothetical protein
MNKKNLQKVIRLLQKTNVKNYELSPNYIANFAYNNDIDLTSKEIVYISDNYKVKNKLLTYVPNNKK